MAQPSKTNKMTKNEIKKALYREKPEAHFRIIDGRDNTILYFADLDEMRVHFEIPISEVNGGIFSKIMEAKLLIRWLDHKD